MLNRMNSFIAFGHHNNKTFDKYCYIDQNIDNWENITNDIVDAIKTKHPDCNFWTQKDSVKINYIKKVFPEIIIVEGDFYFSSEFSKGDIVLFVDDYQNFRHVSRYKIRNFLYTNYDLTDDNNAFLDKKDFRKLKNRLTKKQIDFKNMSKSNSDNMLKKYNTYHYIKNTKKISGEELAMFLINTHGNLFSLYDDDFELFELNFEDFCNFISAQSFAPDFYFDEEGNINNIYSEDLKEHLLNMKNFVEYLKQLPDNTLCTYYDYSLY